MKRTNLSDSGVNRGHKAIRTCVVCRKKELKDNLLRLVVHQGEVVEDIQQRKSGRGAYCCLVENCQMILLKNKKKLNKALRLQVYSNEDGSN